jgi:hypothetical protein
MSDSHSPLHLLQSWMQKVVTHPDGVTAGITASSTLDNKAVDLQRIGDVIKPSSRLGSLERLAIYSNAYFARLIECLGDEFPALKHSLGEDLFDSFAAAYIQECPSDSYTLSNLGRRFPQFLQHTRPVDVPEKSWPDFLIDLATLERTYSEVFDGPGPETGWDDTSEAGQRSRPVCPEDVVLTPVPGLRVLSLQFPAHEYVTSVRRNETPEVPPPSDTWLVITRRDFIVRRLSVSHPEYLLLREVLTGRNLGDAIATTIETTGISPEVLQAKLSGWFQQWAAAGWLKTPAFLEKPQGEPR